MDAEARTDGGATIASLGWNYCGYHQWRLLLELMVVVLAMDAEARAGGGATNAGLGWNYWRYQQWRPRLEMLLEVLAMEDRTRAAGDAMKGKAGTAGGASRECQSQSYW